MNVVESKAKRLLEGIETNPESFTAGRRNDDLVNWYFAKLITLREASQSTSIYEITEAFCTLLNTVLTPKQNQSLTSWEESWTDKLKMCHRYYSDRSSTDILTNLWIDQSY